MATSTECLEVDAILAFLDGRAANLVRNEVDRHLDGCSACRDVVLAAGAPSAPEDRGAFDVGVRTAPIPTFPPGAILAGRYRIGRLLGRGGMGEVYSAEDLQLGATVALKTVNGLVADHPHIAERLKREVLLARRVTHPSVCRVFDFGIHGKLAFFTMELLEGETLGARLRRIGPMATELALPLVEQLAGALEAAHAAGVIHRDFKSDNVILLDAEDGRTRAVVTDFGLARTHSSRRESSSRAQDSAPGRLVGTLSYMAPEQLGGGKVTPSTDVYALGVVLFEMVTGELPFADASPLRGAVRRLTEEPPSPLRIVPGLDPAWDAAIMRCLEREPRKRFARVGAVVDALTAPASAPAGWVRSNRLSVTSLLVVLAVAVAFPITSRALKGSRQPPPVSRPTTLLPVADKDVGREAMGVASPTGSGRPEASPARRRAGRAHQARSGPTSRLAKVAPSAPDNEPSLARQPEAYDDLIDPREDDLIDPYRTHEVR